MKAFILIPLLVLPVLNAQEAKAPMSMEEREASVVQLKQRIKMREDRLQEVMADIKVLDARTEKRIDTVVETLKNTQDSQSSKTRITRLKGEAIAGLRESIQSYLTERRKIFERIRKNNDPLGNTMTDNMDQLDERIQKRASQIMELAKTMPHRGDTDKYETDGTAYYDGRHYQNSRISDKWRQNRRQGTATKTQIDDLIKALGNVISDLERRRQALTARIDGGKLSPAHLELAEHELGQVDAMIVQRKRERLELSKPVGGASGSPADKNSADHLKELFDNARGDIAEDHWTVLKKYDEAINEWDSIIGLKKNLAAREKWLEEHAGE